MTKKTSLISITLVVLLLGTILTGFTNCWTFNGSAKGFTMDTNLKNSYASYLGEATEDQAGYTVAPAGDVNGDGFDDVLISSIFNNEHGVFTGQTYLIFGKLTGWDMDNSLAGADASFYGEVAGDNAGYRLGGNGDVNGDGYSDFVIGAPFNDDSAANAGQAYLFLGKANGWAMDTSLAKSDASFQAEDSLDLVGSSVSICGDVNGDGFDDILIGAYNDEEGGSEAGQVYLIFGKASGWANNVSLSQADASFLGESTSDWAGYSAVIAGDVNGDGLDDILIGAQREGTVASGQSYLIFGKKAGWAMDTNLANSDASFIGEGFTAYSGYAVNGAGDVNGDGFDDMLIGAPMNDDNGIDAGQLYLVLGNDHGWSMDMSLGSTDASFFGYGAGDRLGWYTAGVGDLNKDGFDDFMVGAPMSDDGGADAGEAYVILGTADGWAMDTIIDTRADASFIGEHGGDATGYSLSGAGDVNGDDYPDLLIGSHFDADAGVRSGQAYIIFFDSRPLTPQGLDAQLTVDGGAISLSWDSVQYWKVITGYNLYRSEGAVGPKLIAQLDNTTLSYSDTSVVVGMTYTYYVTAVTVAQQESLMNSSVVITNDRDTDLDGQGDNADQDDDGDGVMDGSDDFPLNATEWLDTDHDGIGNNADTDDDNDGIPDVADLEPLNPLNGLEQSFAILNKSLGWVASNVSGLQAGLDQLDAQLQQLHNNITVFQNETAVSLKAIMDELSKLALNDGNITKEVQALNATVNNLDKTTLKDLKDRLIALDSKLVSLGSNDTTIRKDIKDLLARIDGFQTNTTTQMKTITDKTDTLGTVPSDVQNIKKGQDKTNQKVEAADSKILVIVVLLIVVIVMLLVVAMMAKGSGRNNNAPAKPKEEEPAKPEDENDDTDKDEDEAPDADDASKTDKEDE
jgi:hypothetical protein